MDIQQIKEAQNYPKISELNKNELFLFSMDIVKRLFKGKSRNDGRINRGHNKRCRNIFRGGMQSANHKGVRHSDNLWFIWRIWGFLSYVGTNYHPIFKSL